MRTDPTSTVAGLSADRRQPVWPWLLLPLVVLLMFFLLKMAKDSLPPPSSHHTVLPSESVPSEATQSP